MFLYEINLLLLLVFLFYFVGMKRFLSVLKIKFKFEIVLFDVNMKILFYLSSVACAVDMDHFILYTSSTSQPASQPVVIIFDNIVAYLLLWCIGYMNVYECILALKQPSSFCHATISKQIIMCAPSAANFILL